LVLDRVLFQEVQQRVDVPVLEEDHEDAVAVLVLVVHPGRLPGDGQVDQPQVVLDEACTQHQKVDSLAVLAAALIEPVSLVLEPHLQSML
jgi:hypothetical protein